MDTNTWLSRLKTFAANLPARQATRRAQAQRTHSRMAAHVGGGCVCVCVWMGGGERDLRGGRKKALTSETKETAAHIAQQPRAPLRARLRSVANRSAFSPGLTDEGTAPERSPSL